jgi:hypothetical protein
LALVVIRPMLYWLLGPALNWMPQISLGVITLPFRSDFLGRMFLFSFLSFGTTLAFFYLSLILLSILVGKQILTDPLRGIIRVQLGKIDSFPAIFKAFLPWFATLVLWCLLHKPLVDLGMVPATKSYAHLVEQGVVVGLGIYLAWKYLLVGILLLHLLNSYIYIGTWPFWTFIENPARQILKLVCWIPLRVSKIDFAPLVMTAMIIFGAEYASRGLVWIYQRLPL